MDSTSRSTSRDDKQRRRPGRTTIYIPLPSKPHDYVPGSGPPLQPIQLLPAHDTTAYIKDRVFLPSPGPAPNGKPLPKRMTYLVGWHDLPAATLLVPAMKILDYVSPLMLEEWESNLEQELDAERLKLDKEEKSQDVPTKQRKRGRPPAHSKIEAAVVAESEVVAKAKAKSHPKKGVISLTTPQKKRLEDFEELLDGEASRSRQIEQENIASFQGYGTDEVEMETDSSIGRGANISLTKTSNGRAIIFKSGMRTSREASCEPTPGWSWTPIGLEDGKKGEKRVSSNPPKSKNTTKQGSAAASARSSAQPPIKVTPVPLPHYSASVSSSSSSILKTTNPKPKTPKKRPRSEDNPKPEKLAPETQERDWVVERLEDVQYYEVEGCGIVRYFKVRWEGDWPKDQNPTWEPEDNIPPNMVRNFMKMSRERMKQLEAPSRPPKPPSTKKKSPKQTKLSWPLVRKYSSVSDAFMEDQDSVVESNQTAIDEVEKDEFFVVAEEGEDLSRGRFDGGSMWQQKGAISSSSFSSFG